MGLFILAIVFGLVVVVGTMWALLTGHGGLAVLLMFVAVAGGVSLAIAAKRARISY